MQGNLPLIRMSTVIIMAMSIIETAIVGRIRMAVQGMGTDVNDLPKRLNEKFMAM